MKKVALLGSGWKNCFISAWYDGALKYIRENKMEVNLYYFHCFGNFSMDEKFNLGEYNIFNLPDLDDFDGIIYDATNVEDFTVRELVIRHLQSCHTPVISLVEHNEGFYFCGINNYKAEYELVEHLIQYHGAKTLNFVGGLHESEENNLRKKAYCDCLQAYGIPIEEWRIYENDYDIKTGMSAFKSFRQRDILPDAFVCSNDNQAVGLCYEAQKAGYVIPRDFMVTGFDDFDKAAYYDPTITTVGFDREEMTYKAMWILDQLWKGGDPPLENYIDTYTVFQESCGCVNPHAESRIEHLKDIIVGRTEDTEMTNLLLSLRRDLQNCTSFSELSETVPKCASALNIEAAYLIMNEDILKTDHFNYHEDPTSTQSQVYGYPKRMKTAVSYNPKRPDILEIREQDTLFPGEADEDGGNYYLLSPLHFREREVGYIVAKNAGDICANQAVFRILNTVIETVDNLYHQFVLRQMNQELSRLYVIDSLTGLYNRTAYSRMALPLFARAKREKQPLCVLFFDLDRLKYINDNFGHDCGDFAIKNIASAIVKALPKEAVSIRYGGDEFVSLVPGIDSEAAAALAEKVQNSVSKLQAKYKTEFALSVSTGYVMTDPSQSKKLDDYINEADDLMYEVKQKHHMDQSRAAMDSTGLPLHP